MRGWLTKTLVVGLVIAVTASLISIMMLNRKTAMASEAISIGVEFNTHATPVWVALQNDLFERYGINVTHVLKFRTGLELAAALARGDVKAGWACLGPALLIIDKGIPVKIVAKYHNYGYELVVNPERVKGVSDLNGSVIYTPGKGSPAYLLALKVEEKYHIKFRAIHFMKPQNILAAMLSGRINAAFLPEHYASVAWWKGMRILLTAKEIWPNMPGSFLVISDDLIRKDPELVKKLVEVTYEGVETVKNNLTAAINADSKYLGVPPGVANHSIHMLQWTTEMNLTNIQEYIDFMYAHGILHHELNATEVVDLQFIPRGG